MRENENERKGQRLRKWVRYIPIAVMAVMLVWIGFQGRNMTVDQLLHYSPESLVAAFAFLMVLFGIKSLSIMFPSALLFVAASRIYSTPVALLVNGAGLCVCFSVMYFIGLFVGEREMEHLRSRYQILQKLDRFQHRSPVFLCYIARVISVFPMDVVSIIFGCMKMNFARYLLGSLLGSIPLMIAITFIGTNVTDIGSPAFLFSCLGTIAVILISFLSYYFMIVRPDKQKEKKQNGRKQ